MAFPDDVNPSNLTALDRKKVAFAAHVTKLVADADGVLDMNELSLLMFKFSDELMNACGFIDERGAFTDEYQAVLTRAKVELPKELSDDQKKELIEFFREACKVDGDSAPSEEKVVHAAADLLDYSL